MGQYEFQSFRSEQLKVRRLFSYGISNILVSKRKKSVKAGIQK